MGHSNGPKCIVCPIPHAQWVESDNLKNVRLVFPLWTKEPCAEASYHDYDEPNNDTPARHKAWLVHNQ